MPLSKGQLPYWTHPTYEPGKEHDREWWKKINAEPKPYVPPKSKPKSNPNWPIPKPYRDPHDDDWLSKIGVTGTDVATLAGTKKKKKKKVTESRVLERIKKDFSYKGQPSPNGFPDTPPPKTKDGWHPEYGKVDNRYNKLDPQSAKAMPKTGEASIDKKVEKAKKKKK